MKLTFNPAPHEGLKASASVKSLLNTCSALLLISNVMGPSSTFAYEGNSRRVSSLGGAF